MGVQKITAAMMIVVVEISVILFLANARYVQLQA